MIFNHFSTLRKPVPAPSERVDVFMNRDGGTLWAIKIASDGRPLRAIGPLGADFAHNPKLRLNWRESIDAGGWGMGAFTLVCRGTRIMARA